MKCKRFTRRGTSLEDLASTEYDGPELKAKITGRGIDVTYGRFGRAHVTRSVQVTVTQAG